VSGLGEGWHTLKIFAEEFSEKLMGVVISLEGACSLILTARPEVRNRTLESEMQGQQPTNLECANTRSQLSRSRTMKSRRGSTWFDRRSYRDGQQAFLMTA
jgi:hypothetical protein